MFESQSQPAENNPAFIEFPRVGAQPETEERAAREVAIDILTNCSGRYVHPEGHDDPQSLINNMINVAARKIVEFVGLRARSVSSPQTPPVPDRQSIATEWAARCFGDQVHDPNVRALRLVEESIEFAQSVGVDSDRIVRLVTHVYARPAGDPKQELGGVALTALIAASSIGAKFDDVLDTEMHRVLTKSTEHFAQRNQNKVDAGF